MNEQMNEQIWTENYHNTCAGKTVNRYNFANVRKISLDEANAKYKSRGSNPTCADGKTLRFASDDRGCLMLVPKNHCWQQAGTPYKRSQAVVAPNFKDLERMKKEGVEPFAWIADIIDAPFQLEVQPWGYMPKPIISLFGDLNRRLQRVEVAQLPLIDEPKAITKEATQEVLEILRQYDDKEIEHLVIDLMNKHHDTHFEKNLKRGADGGKDGIGTATIKVGAFKKKVPAILQVKRWKQSLNVSDKDIKAFANDIPDGGIGIFVTTSDFTKAALEAANNSRNMILLINGQQAATAFAQVTSIETVQVPKTVIQV